MRAVVCRELGPLDQVVIEERPTPVPGPGQVVVDARAMGVNFVDGLICQGRYQMKPATPYVPGGEIAGVVSAVADDVSRVAVGDRVMAMTGFGAFAEQVAVNAGSLEFLPGDLGFGQAAAFIQSYSTAWFTMTRRTSVQEGEWVLVLGAGGGIGLASVDAAVALGAQVIAAASSPAKLEAARSMGATATIAYEEEDLKARAREISGGGVDVVIDPVGGRHSEPALRATADLRSLVCDRLRLGAHRLRPAQPGPAQQPDGGRCRLGHVGHGRPERATGNCWPSWWIWSRAGGCIPPCPRSVRSTRRWPSWPGLLDRSVTGKVVLVP